MARKIKPGQLTFRTEGSSFQKGKERPVEIKLFPKYVQVRAVGIQGEYTVNWETILNYGIEAEIRHRINRGALK